MTLAPEGGGVAFDLDALDRNIQHIGAERERDGGLVPRNDRDATFGPSSRSSMTAVDLFEDDTSFRQRFSRHFAEDVDTRWTDILLIVCSLISGMLDSAAFNAWGSFASMQTGNCVFLALGVAGEPVSPSNRWAEALVAISSYILGAVFFIHASRWLQPLRRSTLSASFTLQTAAIVISSVLVQTGIIKPTPQGNEPHVADWMPLIPLSLLAFQAGGQLVTSRLVRFDEVPTVVLTTLLGDLFIDPAFMAKSNPVRNRRVASFLALFLGAMASGLLAKHEGLSCPLWIAAGCKAAITVSWLFWPARRDDKDGGMV